ncbi:alanine dehydrogenase [Pedobacter yonginense]|uniref:Alanine dehydrogenase n=1 Tax=Pedobacter yonginense TaxID=651869 RepID=A0A317EGS0_9SPHI|nr:XdhC/CoxI family protein [Pedobacter yonginense]PWS26021.1 alanine dehydrogenase [Pedobacter yonginense]
MREIKDIIKSYELADKAGLKTALATVVQVEGSSYRRPGARMLICENGQLTGAISGGCLEGDALRKALSAILQQENKLVTYDSTDEDDAKFGVQLGCNGIVYILFEPINREEINNPISLLKQIEEKRENAVLSTLFSLEEPQQVGTILMTKNEILQKGIADDLVEVIASDAKNTLNERSSTIKSYQVNGKSLSALHDFIEPPIALVIAGAGNDVQPLVEIAAVLGWQITVADGRQTHATVQRFPKADLVLVAKPDALLNKIEIDNRTALVLMSHNYNYDLAMLDGLLQIQTPYIGVLGPKKKLMRMLGELEIEESRNLDHVHGPVGLDIGAETAEEIAISIVSEIRAVFARRSGKTLKDKNAPIHQASPTI